MSSSDFDIEQANHDAARDSKSLLSKIYHAMTWKRLLVAYCCYIAFAVTVNVVLYRYNVPSRLEYRKSARVMSQSPDPGCTLDCGNNGVCMFRNRNTMTAPACLCDDSFATFPEGLCGFNTASKHRLVGGVNVTVSECTLGDGRVFVNNDGPCSYNRVGMANVACASWIGGSVGADWFLMMSVGCNNCTIVNKDGTVTGMPYNGGYGAAGFFAILTFDYLTIGWYVNSIRILVGNQGSIPFWDALGFLHSDTIHHNFING